MTFLNQPDLWPHDKSGKTTFLVKAVQDIGRSLGRKELRLPPSVYKYDAQLPDFNEASENDKADAANIVNYNSNRDYVTISETSYECESSGSYVVTRNWNITEKQWLTAKQIIEISKEIPAEYIENAVAITSAIFIGVASEKVVAMQREVDRPNFGPLPANNLNIDDNMIIKARLALGQIDLSNPFDLDPRGNSYIFLDTDSLQRWKNSVGRRLSIIEIAMCKLMRLAIEHNNHLPSKYNRDTLMGEEMIGLNLSDQEKNALWDRLPGDTFKRPGLRQGASRKGSA